MKNSILPLLCLVLGNYFFLVAQPISDQLRLKGVEVVLPNNSLITSSILKAKNGFIWFVDRKGLIRYDGINFLHFYPKEYLDISLSYLFEDRKGRIWLSYMINGGHVAFQVFDPETESFVKIDTEKMVLWNGKLIMQSLRGRGFIVEDELGNIWTRGLNEFLKIREESANQFSLKYYRTIPETMYVNRLVNSMYLDSRHTLWVGTGDGLYSFDIEKGISLRINNSQIDLVTGIAEDQKGNIWVNYQKKGLYSFDPIAKVFTEKWPESSPRWPNNDRYLTSDRSNNLWTIDQKDNGGFVSLDRYNIDTDSTFRYFKVEKNSKTSIEQSEYISHQLDEDGNLWVLFENGIHKFNSKTDSFNLIKEFAEIKPLNFSIDDKIIWIYDLKLGWLKVPLDPQKVTVLSEEPLHENSPRLLEDQKGNLLAAGIDGIFLYTVDKSHYTRKIPILSQKCKLLMLDESGSFWATHSDTGKAALIKIDPHTFVSSTLSLPGKIEKQITSMVEVERNKFLIGTNNDGLILLNDNTGNTIQLLHAPNDSTTILSNYYNLVCKDYNNQVWIFNRLGVHTYEHYSQKISQVDEGIDKKFGLIKNVIAAKDGKFWIASIYGLSLYEPNLGKVHKNYFSKNNYPTGDINSIFTDKNDNLWIATDYGLLYFNLSHEQFTRFYTTDGLPSNVVNAGILKEDGRLLLGGDKGIFLFQPNRRYPKPIITSLNLFNERVRADGKILNRSISYAEKVNLRHDQNVLSFSYSALSFANPDKNQYAYYMEGIDQDWNYVGNETTARYAGLSPGEYTFKLKASNNDGLWNETPTTLAITILPPWWRTIWAYLLYTVVFLGALYTFYRVKVNRKLEMAEAHRLQELNTFKTRFYTNITHEFRTPLTVILGMTEQLDHEYRTVKTMIKRNAQNLLRLVNQLLDLSKLEAGMLTLQMQQGDIIPYIRYVVESFHSLAEHKNITVHYRSEVPQLVMDYDADKMLTVVSNLISNAIKFTPEGGHVSLIVSQIQDTPASRFRLRVMDTGMGIPADQLAHIFDRFYQVDNSTTREGEGTGVGLALTRELVAMLGGTIDAKSTMWQGSEFTVELPVTNTAPTVVDIEVTKPLVALSEEEADFSVGLTLFEEKERQPVALIVEDNMDVVYYLRTCLQSKYTLEVAQNGQQGIDKALELQPDIIISDVMMPEKNGYELCQALKTNINTSHIPIILLTAKAAEEDKLAGLRVGADAYLTKPFNQQELRLRIQNLIKARQRLWRQYQESYPYPIQELDVADPDQQFLTQAIEILEKHKSDSDFHVDSLYKELGVSRTLLHVKLKALTGQSASQFIRTYRLQYAAQLLKQHFGNVAQVAYEAGFNDQSYFTKSFKKHFGLPPSEFVKSNSVSR